MCYSIHINYSVNYLVDTSINFNITRISKNDASLLKEILIKYHYSEKGFKALSINPYIFYDKRYSALIHYQLLNLNETGIIYLLFYFGDEISLCDIENLLTINEIDRLIKINVLDEIKSGIIKSRIKIIPYNKLFFACDFIPRNNNYKETGIKDKYYYDNIVYPISADSVSLAESTIKKKCATTLDLCTGSGFQAVLASTYSKKVIGVDINPRAINFASFNALLNGINNVQFKIGNLFENIIHRRFDRILANPPFEISFLKTSLYRDGGIYGCKVLKEIIQNLPFYLNKYGYCQIVTKIVDTDSSYKNLIESWIGQYHFNTLFLEYANYNIITNAYFNYKNVISFNKYKNTIQKYLSHCQKYSIKKIHFGIFTFQKSRKYSFKRLPFIYKIETTQKPSTIIKKYFENNKKD